MSPVAGYPISVFGVFDLPTFISKDPASAKMLRNGHGVIWQLLAVAAVGHIAAAMFQHFIKKEDVLRSMTVGSKA